MKLASEGKIEELASEGEIEELASEGDDEQKASEMGWGEADAEAVGQLDT